jgi:hypothetical protein
MEIMALHNSWMNLGQQGRLGAQGKQGKKFFQVFIIPKFSAEIIN